MVNYNTTWTPDEVQYLRDNYGRLPFGEVVKQLGKTRGAISGKADRLGLSDKGRTPRSSRNRTVRPAPDVSVRTSPFRLPAKAYEEMMPQLDEGEKLHSRPHADLEPGMCSWPLYVEQGVQMYCAAQTERLPGRFATYCKCHGEMGHQPRAERQARYKRGIWAR